MANVSNDQVNALLEAKSLIEVSESIRSAIFRLYSSNEVRTSGATDENDSFIWDLQGAADSLTVYALDYAFKNICILTGYGVTGSAESSHQIEE